MKLNKEERFNLAHKLDDLGFTQKRIGELVAEKAERKESYSNSTINTWLKHKTYAEYSEASKKHIEEVGLNKKPAKPENLDEHNSIIAVLKAIEYNQQKTNELLERLVDEVEEVKQ